MPKELGELVNLTHFDASRNKLQGGLSTRAERFISATEIGAVCFAGTLPKVLPASLEVLDLSGSDGQYGRSPPCTFTNGIPSEWFALTNLKELKMAYCGLDGKPLRTRTERLNLRD